MLEVDTAKDAENPKEALIDLIIRKCKYKAELRLHGQWDGGDSVSESSSDSDGIVSQGDLREIYAFDGRPLPLSQRMCEPSSSSSRAIANVATHGDCAPNDDKVKDIAPLEDHIRDAPCNTRPTSSCEERCGRRLVLGNDDQEHVQELGEGVHEVLEAEARQREKDEAERRQKDVDEAAHRQQERKEAEAGQRTTE